MHNKIRKYKWIVVWIICLLSVQCIKVEAASGYRKIYKNSNVSIKFVEYTEEGIKIKWDKLENTYGYYIYRKEDNGTWRKYDDVTTRKYVDMYIETGVNYQYAIVGYTYYKGKKLQTAMTVCDKTFVGVPEKIQNVTAKYKSSKKIEIKWTTEKEVSGYYIYRQCDEQAWKKIAQISNPDTGGYIDSITSDNKFYKYKIIPYEIVNDITYEGIFGVKASNAYSDSGIDVSYHNGKIIWSKVKQDGVDFAFIRAGRGEPTRKAGAIVDEQFARNVKYAQKNGIKVGVYFYSCARSVQQARKEAKFLVKLLRKHGEFEYPIVYDFESEYRRRLKYKNQNTKMIEAFCEILTDAGYKAMVYSDYEMFTKYVNYGRISKQYGTWVAYWTYDTNRYPVDLKNVWIWQYSDRGRFNGISEYTDKNVRFISW